MTNVFTIVSCNYLAEARVLMESVARHWPEARRTVFVTDSPSGKFNPAGEDFAVVEATETSLPRFKHMAFAYSPSEFCYVLKPYCAKYLLEKESADTVVYIDADMLLFRRPVELEQALAESSIVLAPHRLWADPEKALLITQLKGGTFNAGMFAVSNSAQGRDFLTWWGTQLTVPANIEMEWHNDQSWLNLVPGYFSETGILRHPGYDVAFWNLIERRVTRSATLEDQKTAESARQVAAQPADKRPIDQETERHTATAAERRWVAQQPNGIRRNSHEDAQEAVGDQRSEVGSSSAFVDTNESGVTSGPSGSENLRVGEWRVEFGGEEYPLVLFHFSLYNPQFPNRLTGETDWARLGDDRTLEPLLLEYAEKLKAAGFEECHRWPYGHAAFRDGKKITKEHREFFKQRFFHGLSELIDPFDPAMEPRGLGSLYNVDHPIARMVRDVRERIRGRRPGVR